METWLKISLILSAFGVLKEFRPSESFVFEFMIGPWRNITEEQVSQEVYPIGIYACLAQLVVVFLITDLCRYKPLIIALGLSGIVTWAMLLWTKSLLELQVLEVFYGTFMATEVAYYTYIYAKVDREHFQKVTSHARAAVLAGRASSGITGQLLISFEVLDYRQLHFISFAALIGATIWGLFLPSVKTSIYFHHESKLEQPTSHKYKQAFYLMRSHFLDSFRNKHVLKWSLWWSLATCGFIQVQTYIQPLWVEIQQETNYTAYNGAVEATITLLGFLGALLAGVLKIDWKRLGELVLAVCSIIGGAAMLINSQTDYIVVSYVCYVFLGFIYYFMITIASSEISQNIQEDSYGLVFGINTFIALFLQTILTMVVATSNIGFGLSLRSQYLVYGLYHMFIASIYIVIGLVDWCNNKKGNPKTDG